MNISLLILFRMRGSCHNTCSVILQYNTRWCSGARHLFKGLFNSSLRSGSFFNGTSVSRSSKVRGSLLIAMFQESARLSTHVYRAAPVRLSCASIVCLACAGIRYDMVWHAMPSCAMLRRVLLRRATLHPVSITRFPLTRFSPGSGLLRNRFCHR